jgi:Uma2 family endonuclease
MAHPPPPGLPQGSTPCRIRTASFGNVVVYLRAQHERQPISVAVRQPPRVTLDDFLAWPGDGSAKHYELVDGEIRAMAPASLTHGLIQATIGGLLWRRLRDAGSSCTVAITPGIVPNVRADSNFRIPDLGVTCSAPKSGQIAMADPILLVEILSPGNERDTRDNVWAYTTIPSVREILVVQSTRIAAEILRRGANDHWPPGPEEIGQGGIVRLDSVGLSCPIGDFYAGTHLVP